MLDRDTGRSAAERKAILFQNPLVLIGLDTLLQLGYTDGYDTEPLVPQHLSQVGCDLYSPNPNLLERKVVGIAIKSFEFVEETQWEIYARVVEIPLIFNAFMRVVKHERDLSALVTPENRVEPGLVDQRVRELGGLTPRES